MTADPHISINPSIECGDRRSVMTKQPQFKKVFLGKGLFKLRLYLALCAKHGWPEIKANYRKLVVIAPPFEGLRAK
jgi:hypothetical protein